MHEAVREAEQRRAAAIVGVRDVDFCDFPDSDIRNCPELRKQVVDTLGELKPDVVLMMYGGPEWAPGPNQRDHVTSPAAGCRGRRCL